MTRWILVVAVVAALGLVAYVKLLAPRSAERQVAAGPPATDQSEAEVAKVQFSTGTPYGQVEAEYDPGAEPGAPNVTARCRCFLEHPAIGGAFGPVDVTATGRYEGTSFKGTVEARGVVVAVTAALSPTELAAGNYRLEPTDIAKVYDVFAPLVPEARRAEIRGTIEGNGEFRLLPLRFTFRPTVTAFAVDGLVGPEYRMGRFTFMGRNATGDMVPVQGGEGSEGWIALADVGRMLPAAVISAEDAAFQRHPGYDVDGMVEAAHDNDVEGGVVRGGSTLSQQLAKNLFLTPERTYARKLRELLYAVEMERELGKDRILELYLNVVEWGPAVRGAKPATEAYFLKQPLGLLPEEAAFLASILRNPRGGWAKEYVGGRVQTRRLSWILDNMVILSPEERAAALARDVHFVPPKN